MKGESILIVEDSQTQLESLQFLLEGAGFSTFTAANGEMGLASARANEVDLVLSDIVMPEMDGYDLCRTMCADPILRSIPVVLLTSLDDPADVIRALESGAAGFIRKPYEVEHLLSRIRDVLATRRMRRSILAENGRTEGIDILFSGRAYSVTAGSAQILGLLLSTFEDFVHHDAELVRTQEELRVANESLEARIAERTAELTAEIAERKRAEQAARDQSEELDRRDEIIRQQQRLETVGQLAAGIAHDFNNLLTGISGFADLAYEALPEGSGPREDIGEVIALAIRAAEMTRQLLAFSRHQTMKLAVVDLNLLVERLTRTLGRMIGEQIQAVFVPAAGIWDARADPGLIEQVVMNLVVNARDAMKGGGVLTIETDNVQLDQEWAEAHPGTRPGAYVMLAVSDTGCGMTHQVLEHIFEPFFTTKGVGEGTGLGLATVYGIVRQHEGSVWAYSEPGSGSTFRVYLPIASDGDYSSCLPAPDATPTAPVTGTETILVVEDEETVRSFVRRVLSRHGYQVLTAASGDQALELLSTESPIDLLITDVVMPRMTGPELAKTVAAKMPDVAVLFMSGYTRNAFVRAGHAGVGIDFIEKPFTATTLARRAREALDSGRTWKSAGGDTDLSSSPAAE